MMMKPMMKPNRDNYEQFCEEPQWTEEEHREWKMMAQEIRGDDALQEALYEATREEAQALMDTHDYITDDWSDMVAWADASSRLMRAELEWWRNQQ